MDNESGRALSHKKKEEEKREHSFKTLNLEILFFPRVFLKWIDLVTSRNSCADSESLSLPLESRRERCEQESGAEPPPRARGHPAPLLSRR